MRTNVVNRRRLVASCAAAIMICPGATFAQAPSARPATRDHIARDLACGPQALILPPAPTLRLVGGQERGKGLFGPGETIVIGAGTAQGVRVGQEYVVRRVVEDRFALSIVGFTPISIHTAGWVRIVQADATVAIATVTDACDGLLEGDYLEEFVPPARAPVLITMGEPDYASPGHLVLADERRQMGGAGTLMVVDRGSNHGLRAGQRLTVFRYTAGGGPVFRVGEATIAVIYPETSLVRIDTSRDAIYVGDLVAMHR